jgi:hypothetical protein
VEGDPLQVLICHCLECQKASGNVFSIWGYWFNAAISAIKGQATRYRRGSDLAGLVDNYFCPACGSTVYGDSESVLDQTAIAIGNFSDPEFNPPALAVWSERRHHWVELPKTLPEYPRQPTSPES